MRPLLLTTLLLSTSALLACGGGPSGLDGGENPDPIPLESERIFLGQPFTPERVRLAGVSRATFMRTGGQVLLDVEASQWELELSCSDFGCIWFWKTVPMFMCFGVDGEGATLLDGGCPRGPVPNFRDGVPDAGVLESRLNTFSGVPGTTISHEGGVMIANASGGYDFIGGSTLLSSEAKEFGNWTDAKMERLSKVGVYGQFHSGQYAAEPVIFPTPDGSDLVPDLMAFVDEGQTRLYFRNRDDGLFTFQLKPRSVPQGRFLDNGVFGYQVPYLGKYDYKAGGRTVAVAELDGELLVLLDTLSYETTVDHDNGAIGGGYLHNLWLRRRPPVESATGPITRFAAFGASTPAADQLNVCFNRPLGSQTLSPDKFTIEGGAHPISVGVSPGNQCALLTIAPMDHRLHPRLHIQGITAEDGEPLSPEGLVISFQPEPVTP